MPQAPASRSLVWSTGLPVSAIVAFSLAGLVMRDMTAFQLAMLGPLAYGLVVFTVGSLAYRAQPLIDDGEPLVDDELPFVSIMVPAHNEEAVIGHTLNHLLRLDYPRFEVIVIDDHSSDRTGAILRDYPVKVVTRRGLPNRGKSEALNAGLEVAEGDVICVFDADSEVSPDFLRLAVVPLVNDAEVCGVQSQVRMYNRRRNFLTQAQDDEFALYNEIMQVGRNVLGGAAALGGNGQLTRRSSIRAVGGWSPASLTEDLDLTMRLFLAGRGRIAHCTAAVVWQEGVPELGALVRQRTRWAQGMLHCFGDYGLKILRTPHLTWGGRLDAFYSLFSAFLPLVTLAGLGYSALALVPGFFQHQLPGAAGAASSLTLLFAACVWSAIVSVKRDSRVDLMPGLRYMVYLLHWVPAVLSALGNVWRDRPVIWEKTEHLGHDFVNPALSTPLGLAGREAELAQP